MALQDVGVIFLSKGFADFMRNMGKATVAIASFGNMTQNKLRAVKYFSDTAIQLSRDLKNMAVSNDRVKIAQERSIQTANNLKKAQAQIVISANNAKIAQASFAKSINDVQISANRTAVSLKRLEIIDNLNNMLAQGAISSQDYATGLMGVNNTLRNTAPSASRAEQALGGLQNLMGSIAGNIGGVFSSAASFGNMGAMIGGALGTIFPVIGNVIGALGGYILGAIAGLGVGIVKSITGIVASIGKILVNAGKRILNWIVSIFKSIISTIGGFFSTIFNMLTGGIFQSGWNNLGNTIVSSMLKFEILKQVIRKVVNEISDLSKESVKAAGDLQTLTARLNFLIAAQAQAAGVAKDFDTAIAMAVPITQELLKWSEKLALSSPISIDDVTHTLSMGIAMGWTAEGAKTLTKSIIDYTAATGLGSEISERIIYNFAQMKQQGKVTGTELRDLGRGAFMPINTILEIMYKNLGDTTMSFEQFREEAAAGRVDVEGFFSAFEEFVGTRMPDAAYKMNFTLQAVIDNLHDLFKILMGWNVLGPLVKSLTKPLQNLIDRLKTDEVLLAANRIGKALAFVVEQIKAGVAELGNAIGGLFRLMGMKMPSVVQVVQTIIKIGLAIKESIHWIAGLIQNLFPIADDIGDKFGKTFRNMREDFFSWGANLVISFAKGMMEAASKVLTTVMNFIARILTGWLKGHSPPKILPDIGKWGLATINEWLHGFTQADFTILDSLKSSVKEALTALVNLGSITPTQSSKLYENITVGIIQALDEFNKTGKITTDIFGQLATLGGVYGQEISELLTLQLQLATATETAAQAQIDYDNAVKASARTEVKANKLVRDYNAMVRKGANKNTLKDKLKMVNAAQIELGVNKKAEITTKSALDLAVEQQKLLEDQVKLQESIIKQLTDIAQAEKDAGSAAEQAAEDLADAIDNIDWGAGNPTEDWDLQTWIDEATAQFEDWKNNTLPLLWGDAGNKFFGKDSEFGKAWSNLTDNILPQAFGKATGIMRKAWDDFAAAVHLPSWEEITEAWNNPGGGIPGQEFSSFPRDIVTSKPSLVDRFLSVLKTFSVDIQNNGGILTTLQEIASYILKKIGESIQNFASDTTRMENITKGINDVLGWIGDIFTKSPTNNAADSPLGKIISGLTELVTKAATNLTESLVAGNPVYDAIFGVGKAIGLGIFDGMANALTTEEARVKLENIVRGMLDKLPPGVRQFALAAFDLGTAVTNKLVPVTPTAETTGFDLSKWATQFGDAGTNAATSIYTNFDTTMSGSDWNTSFSYPISTMQQLYIMKSPSELFGDAGENIAQSFYDGANNLITQSLDWASMWVFVISKTRETLGIDKGLTNPFYLVGRDMVWGIIAGFQSMIETLKSEWNALVMLLPEDARDRWLIESPSKLFKGMGANIVKGLALGISDSMYLARGAMSGLITTTATPSFVMNAPVSAPPVYGGNTANFNGDIHINNGLDWAMFKAQVQKAIVEG